MDKPRTRMLAESIYLSEMSKFLEREINRDKQEEEELEKSASDSKSSSKADV